ncbi:MAG: hypothetical protein R3B54_01165 [Bdellovibrionota bacterium]
MSAEPYVRKDLNLKDLVVGPNEVFFVVGGQSSVGNTATHPVVELQVWEVVEHTLNSDTYSVDVQLKASRTLNATEFHAGAAAPHVHRLEFQAEANKIYDFRVKILGNLSSVTHFSTAVVSNFSGLLPESSVFQYAGKFYSLDSARGALCRYLSFSDLRINQPSLLDPSTVTTASDLPSAIGGGLCPLVVADGAVLKIRRQVGHRVDPLTLQTESVPRVTYYTVDEASKKVRRCLSRFDLIGTGVVSPWEERYPFEDADNYPFLNSIQRLANYTEDDSLSCTGVPLPEIPDFPNGCVETSWQGKGVGHLCSTDPAVNFEYRYATPESPTPYPYCTNLRFFAESINHYLCADSDLGATWHNNLTINVVRPDSIWQNQAYGLNTPFYANYMVLPEDQWCVELVDYKTVRHTNNYVRNYLCTPADRKFSYTPDEGVTWYHSFYTYPFSY